MKTLFRLLVAVCSVAVSSQVRATVHYVDVRSTNPVAPYLDWSTAATNIQDAVDAALGGDMVLVTNGLYQSGGGVVYGSLSNRVAVTKPLLLQSVNGPEVTQIQGQYAPVSIVGEGAVRCVYLTNDAVLSGFTLTNGATRDMGDANTQESGGGAFCESTSVMISNCVVIRCESCFGGAAVHSGSLYNCSLINNTNVQGAGGMANGLLDHCNLIGNSGAYGGASSSTLSNCLVDVNLGWTAGGAYNCQLYNCQILSNYCRGTDLGPADAGGVLNCIAVGCTISSNACRSSGGGACLSFLTNCVLSFNRATNYGGGEFCSLLDGCSLSNNWAATAGGGGSGYLSPNTTNTLYNCLLTANSSGGGGGTHQLTLYGCTLIYNTATSGGGAMQCTLVNCLLATNSASSQGGGANGCTVSNCTFSGNFAPSGGGAYASSVLSTGWNCGFFGNWATGSGGGANGYILYNCTLAGNAATNSGGGATACQMTDCIVSNNLVFSQGGGVSGGFATNCILVSNLVSTVTVGQGQGGGAYGGAFADCVFLGNRAQGGGVSSQGGGAYQATLYDCTLAGNSAQNSGGGASQCTLNNCILYFNTAASNVNYTGIGASLNRCCTTPQAVGSITNDPLFVNLGAGDLRLQSNSACINSGNNVYAKVATDLDGNPRIVGGTVDIGAYEFQTPTSVISYAWLQQYGLSTDGSADFIDSDGDGMSNWQEWRSGTIPTNSASVLALTSITQGVSGATVTWPGVNGISYSLQRSTNLTATPAFISILANIAGHNATLQVTDPGATNAGPYFYRVMVQ